MKRLLVIGCGASGKTTFARRLSDILKLPVIHLDSLYWKPGWQRTPDAEWEGIVRDIIAEDQWIIDGSYTGTLALRLTRADTVIYLDYPRRISYWHILKRRFMYRKEGSVRPGLPEGCPEQIFGTFLKWVWRYPKRDRPKVLRMIEESGCKAIMLRSLKEADKFLASFG